MQVIANATVYASTQNEIGETNRKVVPLDKNPKVTYQHIINRVV